MKNKYMKHSHISEAKFRQIIHLFAADLTAAQIAEITKISRPAINVILLRIRSRIAKLAEKESFFKTREIEIDESYFGARRVRGKRGHGS
jgi:transposase